MTIHLERDLKRLEKELWDLGALVEDSINRAIAALVQRRPELAEEVVQGDMRIDEKEIQVEEECLKVLALHQPVAGDLRFIIMVLKVNNDLERMGDLAVNIAERAIQLARQEPLPVHLRFPEMTDAVKAMVRRCLNALFSSSAEEARAVLKMDDAVDQFHRGMFDALQELMRRDPDTIERAIHYLSASRHLERIADLATNIAEDIVFLVEGRIIRHRPPNNGT